MQLDAILEVAVGLILTWLILSMATSQIQEAIIESLGWRSTFLERRLQEMFHDPALVAQFYKHPLIESLSARTFWGRKRKPKGIPNPIFARAAVDVFLNAGKVGNDIPAGTMSLEVMKQSVVDSFKYLDNSNQVLSRTVKYLVPKLNQESTDVENTLVKYRENVETWFDATMSQATLLYRKHASLIALVLGITLASGFNVDSLVIVNHLWRDPTLRQAIVAQADNINPEESFSVTGLQDQLNELSLPIGWNNETTPQSFADWLLKFLGIILTGLAASLGAPFWFDILNKLLGLKPNNTEKG